MKNIRHLVYCGVRTDNGKNQWLSFRLVNDDGITLQPDCLFGKKGFKGFNVSVGSKCECDVIVNERGSLETIRGVPNPIKIWHDKDDVAAMRALNDACVSVVAAHNQTKKDGANVVLDCLKPLRQAYKSTNAVGRTALEVRVLNYLRNGRDL
ncbi:hypothetical protein NVP3058O_041 [Vibrio phage 3.058.O._10N.286.46.B8]|nr:hypothetical protein NVP2058O_042 [Vibrio phage 2.058.O._10N.286.46.B8]AUS03111.1 hypothetical protein NVP3058O_041 [Vibrio phage 3.058.O._10N.286.46.B8]